MEAEAKLWTGEQMKFPIVSNAAHLFSRQLAENFINQALVAFELGFKHFLEDVKLAIFV
jgi:hypothetical protein